MIGIKTFVLRLQVKARNRSWQNVIAGVIYIIES